MHNTAHRTVLTIFPLILQTIIIAEMMSTGGEEYSSILIGQEKPAPVIIDGSFWDVFLVHWTLHTFGMGAHRHLE